MNQNDLSTDERKALRDVRNGLIISDELKHSLNQKGYIQQKLGGWTLTDKGNLYDSRF